MIGRKTTLGYVLSLAVGENVFMGGAMVTDSFGLPLEFRYTEPVRATRLQRVLYGDVLEKYIHCDVIAGNLVGRLEQKPDLYIVVDPILLPALDSLGKAAALLAESRVPPLKEYGAIQEIGDGEYFLQLTDSGAPTRVRVPFESQATDAAKKAEAARVLTEIGRTMEPLEPLARVETAVKMLWEEVPETPVAA